MVDGEAATVLLSDKATRISLSNGDGVLSTGQSAELLVPKEQADEILAVLGTDSLFVVTTGGAL